jgi:hypothetical protein
MRFIMFDYLSLLEFTSEVLEYFKDDVLEEYFKSEKANRRNFVYTTLYHSYWEPLYNLVLNCDVLGIDSLCSNKKGLLGTLEDLGRDDYARHRDNFLDCINSLSSDFEISAAETKEKVNLLGEEEFNRLNEALNNYINECDCSAVILCVSAIECRLYTLLSSKCADHRLKDLTLGQLIHEYLTNKSKYGIIIPEKHEPLLQLANTYRIFAVHPNIDSITRSVATSIICMSFVFLFDKNVKTEFLQ